MQGNLTVKDLGGKVTHAVPLLTRGSLRRREFTARNQIWKCILPHDWLISILNKILFFSAIFPFAFSLQIEIFCLFGLFYRKEFSLV